MHNTSLLIDKNIHKIIFIVGLYKTGTSLLTKLVTDRYSYKNLAFVNNSNERGYGQIVPRYFTYECKEARSINKQILEGECTKSSKIKINDYINNLSCNTVIKDPLFCWTLSEWIDVLKNQEKLGDLLVLFTVRDNKEMEKSWKSAPYTNKLIANNALIIEEMLEALIIQKSIVKEESISFQTLEFNDFRLYDNTSNL